MIELRLYHAFTILLLALVVTVCAEDFWTLLQRESAAKDDREDHDDDAQMDDDEYETWLEKEIDQQIALLESIMGVSDALSVADAPLDNLDEDFLDEILRAKLKLEGAEGSEPEQPHTGNSAKKFESTDRTSVKSTNDAGLEQLLELAVNVLGSMVSETEQKTSDAESQAFGKQVAKQEHSCLDDREAAAKCSGDFQRWIVYKNGGFCKPTENGECKGVWYQDREALDCVEICIYAPLAQEKKLSIRLAANSHLSTASFAHNDTTFSS